MSFEEAVAYLSAQGFSFSGTRDNIIVTFPGRGERFTLNEATLIEFAEGELAEEQRLGTEQATGREPPREPPIDNTPPVWWEPARDGQFPKTWDNNLLGEFPSKPTPTVVNGKWVLEKSADLDAAKEKFAARRALEPEEESGFQGFPTTAEGRQRAEERAQEIGGEVFYDSKSDTYRVREAEEDFPLGAGRPETQTRGKDVYAYNPKTGEYDDYLGPVPEEAAQAGKVVTIGGRQFIRQPDGSLQVLQPEPARDFDDFWNEMADDLFDTGDFFALADLWDKKQAIEAGQMSPMDIFNLVAPQAQNPQHFVELWNNFATQYDTWRESILGGQRQESTPGQVQRLEAIPLQSDPRLLRPGETGLEYGARTGQGGGVPTDGGVTGQGKPHPGGLTDDQWNSLTPQQQQEALDMEEFGLERFLRKKQGKPHPGGLTDDQWNALTPGQQDAAQGMEELGLEEYLRRVQRGERASAEAIDAVLAKSRQVERTGSFDPNRPAFGRFGRAGTLAGTRTEVEEAQLRNFLVMRDQAANRGVGVPPDRQELFDRLSAKAPFQPAAQNPFQAAARKNPFLAATPRINETVGAPFGGTAEEGGGFSPIPKDPFAELFTRQSNERRQQAFTRRRPRRTTFR